MKTITLDIDEQLLERVSAIASSQNRTVQEILIELLVSLDRVSEAKTAAIADQSEYDPITPLLGSLQLDTQDLAENHDFYLGQALYRELQGDK